VSDRSKINDRLENEDNGMHVFGLGGCQGGLSPLCTHDSRLFSFSTSVWSLHQVLFDWKSTPMIGRKIIRRWSFDMIKSRTHSRITGLGQAY
jgi:hypothetical protein